MTRDEWGALVRAEIERLRGMRYDELQEFLRPGHRLHSMSDGRICMLEIQAFPDSPRSRNLRLIVSAHDDECAGHAVAVDDFIISPDGRFVGE